MKKLVLVLLALPLFAQETAPVPPPVNPWSSSIGAGLTITSGNSDTMNINLAADTKWDPKTDRLFKAEVLYLFGENDGEKQVDKSTAHARYEQLFQARAFWFGELGYLHDTFKGIDYLVSPLVGAGYHVIQTDTRKLTLDGALGAVVEENDLGRDTSGAVKAGETFDWAISPASKVTQKLTGLWKADDFDDALYHFEAGLTTTVATRLEMKVSYVYDYKNQTPAPDIEKGDSALFASLLVKF